MKKGLNLIFLALLVSASILFAQSEVTGELSRIIYQKLDHQLEILVEYKGELTYEVFTLEDPLCLVLDFTPVSKISIDPLIEIEEGELASIRSALFKPEVARVVFNFIERIPHYTLEEKENGIVIVFSEEAFSTSEESEKGEQIIEEEKEEKQEEMSAKPAEIEELKRGVTPVKEETPQVEKKIRDIAVGFSYGYSFFQDSVFKEVYGDGGYVFRGELSFLLPVGINNFDLWTSASHFSKEGKTSLTAEELKLTITSFSLALRYLRKVYLFTPFIGTGVDYIVYKEKYPEDFVISSVGGSDVGYHLQAGTYFDPLPFLALKIYFKYLWSETVEDEIRVNLGGVEYSLSLIYRFNL